MQKNNNNVSLTVQLKLKYTLTIFFSQEGMEDREPWERGAVKIMKLLLQFFFKISFEFCRFASFRRSSDVNSTTARERRQLRAPK